MSNFFFGLHKWISSNIGKFSVLFILALVILGFTAAQVHLSENIEDLIPKKKQNKELQEVLDQIHFTDQYVIKFELADSLTIDNLTSSAQNFLDSVSTFQAKYIDNIQGKVTDEEAESFLKLAYEFMPLYLKKEDYKKIDSWLNKDSIFNITQRNYNNIISSTGLISKQIIPKDPLGLSLLGLQNIREHTVNNTFLIKNNFLVSPDERQLLLIITPNPNLNPKQLDYLSNAIIRISDNIQKASANIEILMYGGPLIAKGNADRIKRDVLSTVGIALILLVLLLILYYRKLIIPFLLLVPTLIGGLIGLSVLFLLKPEVSSISLGIGAILLGVTIDFSLHIATHLKKNPNVADLYQTTTAPILMSALTTSLAFFCLNLIDSPALNDLGLFASISVFSSACVSLIFIPLVYKPQLSPGGGNHKVIAIEKIAAFNYHQNKPLIVSVVALLIISIVFYGKVGFNNDLSKLNYLEPRLEKAEKELDELTLAGSKSLYAVSYHNDFQEALRTNDALNRKLEKLKNENRLESFTSISPMLKSDSLQSVLNNTWRNFWTQSKIDSLQFFLNHSAAKVGFKQNTFQPFINRLRAMNSKVDFSDYNEIPSLALRNFITTSTELNTITSIIKVREDQINPTLNNFKDEPSLIIIDRQKLNEDLLGHLKSEFNLLLLYCSVAIILLLLVFYRNIRLTLVTLLPILITWIITIGLMGLFKVEFNVFNIIISSFVFGLGVDYSIFITNGLMMKHKENPNKIITSKVGILLSVLTTITGVGVMVFAEHPALHSISMVSVIAIFTAVLVSFTLQPIAFKFLMKNTYGKN
ncbi:MMPL family transporter [Aegicerativicinus sediminis]|uniref:MMPL family transporter n=1 Tax=Aegicerativicinus sediminis TaxID=2893202 RepID=UPI001E2B4354|nr:MMPL family transporter [Aegicerativicinus sediminis]